MLLLKTRLNPSCMILCKLLNTSLVGSLLVFLQLNLRYTISISCLLKITKVGVNKQTLPRVNGVPGR